MFGTFFNESKKDEDLLITKGGDKVSPDTTPRMNATSRVGVTFGESQRQSGSRMSNSVGNSDPLNITIPGAEMKTKDNSTHESVIGVMPKNNSSILKQKILDEGKELFRKKYAMQFLGTRGAANLTHLATEGPKL